MIGFFYFSRNYKYFYVWVEYLDLRKFGIDERTGMNFLDGVVLEGFLETGRLEETRLPVEGGSQVNN